MSNQTEQATARATDAPSSDRQASYRQGDVLLIRVATLPHGARLIAQGHVVLAEGEITGHLHEVTAHAELFAPDTESRFLRLVAPEHLVHPEHDPLSLEPGLYEVRHQRQYRPIRPLWIGD